MSLLAAELELIGKSVRCYASGTSQSIADDTAAVVNLTNTDVNDSTALFTPNLTTDRITVNTAGPYLINFEVLWQPGASGYRSAFVTKNGGNPIREAGNYGVTGNWDGCSGSGVVRLDPGDYIQLNAYQYNGNANAVSLDTSATHFCGLTITRLGINTGDSLDTIPHVTKTASYTAALTDLGTLIEFNSTSGTDLTIPPHSSVGFPVDAVLCVRRVNTGAVGIVAGSGVVVQTPASLTLRTRWSTVELHQRAIDEWVASGDLS